MAWRNDGSRGKRPVSENQLCRCRGGRENKQVSSPVGDTPGREFHPGPEGSKWTFRTNHVRSCELCGDRPRETTRGSSRRPVRGLLKLTRHQRGTERGVLPSARSSAAAQTRD